MLEQVAGVGYIAMVVSRLITLPATRTAERNAERDDDGTVWQSGVAVRCNSPV